jgi:hypothetical protein
MVQTLACLLLLGAACANAGGGVTDARPVDTCPSVGCLDPRCPPTPAESQPCEPIGLTCHYFEYDYGCGTDCRMHCLTHNAFGDCHMPPAPDAGETACVVP